LLHLQSQCLSCSHIQ